VGEILAHEALREQAVTDPLTGLGNRRKLSTDLTERLDGGSEGGSAAASDRAEAEPLVLMMFDLDGFKGYNDTFGHLAGDALLARLGGKLAAAVFPHGTAYRLGGDEFCALLPARAEGLQATVARAAAALCERGETFTVQASCGAVLVPHEASTADYALQLADERMYARKASRPSAVREQTRDVLVRIMHAKQPGLPDHSTGVAQLAVAVGRRLGMDAEQIDELGRAAELHDIGKVGIPDAILGKPGTLNSEEWEFIRQHTILGERILSAAPALRPVATIVRASHERWDGRGYPDRLRGEQIPLAARIVAVCDAYEAITDNRCYRGARSSEEAREELLREAGGQFDPAVVAAFLEELDAPQPVAPAVPTADEEAAWQLAGEVVERFGLLLGPEVAASETRSVVTTE
jgi:diguanylate cyclase (GGDEF)-like protein